MQQHYEYFLRSFKNGLQAKKSCYRKKPVMYDSLLKNVWIKGQTFFCGNKYGDGDDQKRQQQSNFHPASLNILWSIAWFMYTPIHIILLVCNIFSILITACMASCVMASRTQAGRVCINCFWQIWYWRIVNSFDSFDSYPVYTSNNACSDIHMQIAQ